MGNEEIHNPMLREDWLFSKCSLADYSNNSLSAFLGLISSLWIAF